jgi:ankyrin repeat protein
MARLLEQGLDVNARKDYPFLQQAVGNHQIEMIRLLIEKGADIRIQDTQQNTLLHSIFDPKLLEYLLQKGSKSQSKESI